MSDHRIVTMMQHMLKTFQSIDTHLGEIVEQMKENNRLHAEHEEKLWAEDGPMEES